MSADIVGLYHEVKPTAPIVKEDVVKTLENLLEMAKGGELIGVHVITLHPGDLTNWRTAGRNTRGMIGAAMMMHHEVIRASLENT